MRYLVQARGRYYYNRRTPLEFQEYDNRKVLRIALRTDSRSEAVKKAVLYNEQAEAYWHGLAARNETYDKTSFGNVVETARKMGLAYEPMSILLTKPILELVERILLLKESNPKQVEAVLGAKMQPDITLKGALELFWKISSDKILNKSANQIRKWKNPRSRSINNFIALVGDKSLTNITRDDVIKFRDWWLWRIEKEGRNADSANKDLINLKNILSLISDHLKLGLDIAGLFKKMVLKVRFQQTRLPFSAEQIKNILTSETLEKLNDECKYFLFALAETGARPSELAGLLPEDICLNALIPHISITDRKERPLKNAHTARIIPLTGYALQAFIKMPKGFPTYRDRADNLTLKLNTFFRDNKLAPSNRHTCYSFRHSFQDRILSVNTPDRVQAELMGHKFARPKYGDGSSLEQKLEYLLKVSLMI